MRGFIVVYIFMMIIIGCNDKSKGYDFYKANKDVGQYYKVKYYMKENRVNEVNIDKIDNLVEYYKVTFSENDNPIREGYFKHNRNIYYKIFNYSNNELKSIIKYDSKDKKLRESIYKNKQLVNTVIYIYGVDKYSIKEKRYKNGQPSGWWTYYDAKNRPIKEELFEKGKLAMWREYQYDKNDNIVLEKQYNSNGKLIYSK